MTMHTLRFAATLLCLLPLVGCTSISELPASSAEVRFTAEGQGKIGWSRYREETVFRNTSREQIVQAALAGLKHARFAVRRIDREARVIIGEHGMTLVDWNVVAGVYFEADGNDMRVVLIAQGSKDVGLAGDATQSDWTNRILAGMRMHLDKASR